MVGLIVYESNGTYYSTFEVGKIPNTPPSAHLVFTVTEESNLYGPKQTLDALLSRARAEANRRSISVVNLTD